MVYEADTLRDQIEAAWALTGHLSKTFNAVTNPYPVEFDAQKEYTASLEKRKLVTVIKNTALSNERRHELFSEINNVYEIYVRYNVEGKDEASYDEAESNTEDMEEEVIRIIKTIYDPNAVLGNFFHTDYQWRMDDKLETTPPMLQRILQLTLTRIESQKTTVFRGFGGVLLFKVAGSEGVGLPGSDYTYTEAFDVDIDEGFDTIEEPISAHPDGDGIPIHFRGLFKGNLNCKIYAKKADVGAGTHQFNTILKTLSNQEQAEVFFIYKASDTETVPVSLEQTAKLRAVNLRRIGVKDQLNVFHLKAKLLKPTAYALV